MQPKKTKEESPVLPPLKRLYVVRHAKSSWEDAFLKDFDRPLNARGQRDAPFMGKLMKEKAVCPSVVLTSPANRALTTAKIFVQELGLPADVIDIREEFYEMFLEELILQVRNFEDEWASAMIFGHNPELTNFVNKFTEDFIPNIPTCGVVCIAFQTPSWTTIDKSNAQLEFFEYPKKYFKVED